MNNVESTLLIILAVGFAILLVLSIVVVYILVQIMRNIRNVTEKVSTTADSLPEIARVIGKRVGPVALSTLVGMIIKKARNKRKYTEDDDE